MFKQTSSVMFRQIISRLTLVPFVFIFNILYTFYPCSVECPIKISRVPLFFSFYFIPEYSFLNYYFTEDTQIAFIFWNFVIEKFKRTIKTFILGYLFSLWINIFPRSVSVFENSSQSLARCSP